VSKASTSFVLDSSVALAWCFVDEKAVYPQSVLDSLTVGNVAIVPNLWHLEVANIFLVSERRKRCTNAEVVQWLGFLLALPIQEDTETSKKAWGDTLHLGRSHGLSVYDASYLELALRVGVEIATLDVDLRKAAVKAGVKVFTP